MWRGWIIFSSLVLSVLFRLFDKHGKAELNNGQDWAPVHFLFSDKTLNRESWVYFTMEHVIAIAIAGCLLIRDNTPRHLLWLFFAILAVDMLHYWLFFRDEGIGFNLVKVLVFGTALIWTQLKQLRNPA